MKLYESTLTVTVTNEPNSREDAIHDAALEFFKTRLEAFTKLMDREIAKIYAQRGMPVKDVTVDCEI